MKHGFTALLSCLLLVFLLPIAGCSRETGHIGDNQNEGMAAGTETGSYSVLTNRFEETIRFSPDDDAVRGSFFVTPYYDRETGTLTIFGERDSLYAELIELSSGGNILRETELPANSVGNVRSGIITENSFLWCGMSYLSGNYFLERCLKDGTGYSSVCVSEICGNITADKVFVAEGHGVLLWAGFDRFLAFDEEMELLFSLTVPDEIVGAGFLTDGSPSFITLHGVDHTVWRVDPGTYREEEYERIPEVCYQVFYAEGADYYYLTRDGIYGMTDHRNTLVMSKTSSGFREEQQLLTMAGTDCAITIDYLSSDNAFVLWERVEDLEVSTDRELKVVFTGLYSQSIDRAIADYNRSHPELTVTVINLAEGERTFFSQNADKFIFELANGFTDADLIVTTQHNSLVDIVLSKRLYQDLMPYLEKDETVNSENLFSVVVSTFQTKDGGIWGLTPLFSLDTVAGLRDVLKPYSHADGWTLDDIFDFASSLSPEGGAALGKYLTQMNADTILGSSGFNRWIDADAGTCSFTDASFERYLDYAASLPKDRDELKHRYPFVDELYHFGSEALSDAWRTGKVALFIGRINGVYDMITWEIKFGTWGTDNLMYVGYPTAQGGSEGSEGSEGRASLMSSDVCIIPKTCRDPDAAWDLIRAFFESEPILETERLSDLPFPSLKSQFEKTREAFGKYYILYRLTEDGLPSTAILERGEETPEEAARRLAGDGLLIDVSQDYLDKVYALLDGTNAIPIADYTPADILAIIQEEISAFTGGGQNRETCMKNIQSRVSIWLAEHQ